VLISQVSRLCLFLRLSGLKLSRMKLFINGNTYSSLNMNINDKKNLNENKKNNVK
jgi:hypothetical protein